MNLEKSFTRKKKKKILVENEFWEIGKKGLERDNSLKGERPKGLKYPWRSWKDLVGNWYNYLSVFETDPEIELLVEKVGAAE